MVQEIEFLRSLQRRFPPVGGVLVGIGDDGAVLDNTQNRRTVIVTDMLLDDVHFRTAEDPPEAIGRKAITVNLSDLAAMACRPVAAFLSLAIPARGLPGGTAPFLERLYDGIAAVCEEFSVHVAGGDTNSWNGPFAVNVCLTGVPLGEEPTLRSGGRPGDQLFVSGPLGGSLRSGRHLRFTPRIETARWLTQHVTVNAMIDLSDGLAIDLQRLTEACDLGAQLRASEIPVHDDVPADLPPEDRLAAALGDGEDFELLLAVSDEDALILSQPSTDRQPVFHPIGRLEDEPGCRLQHPDGRLLALPASGWQHALG